MDIDIGNPVVIPSCTGRIKPSIGMAGRHLFTGAGQEGRASDEGGCDLRFCITGLAVDMKAEVVDFMVCGPEHPNASTSCDRL